jgi:hypothetical protein
MTKRFLFLLIPFITMLQAGESKYLLYHVNKDVQWVHDGVNEKAKRGVFLLNAHSLILRPTADVMLLQQDGQSLLLSKPGTYSFARINQLFNSAQKTNISAAFFSYVFEKFTNAETEEKQRVTATVFRGKKAMLVPGDSSFLLSFPVTLQWKPEQKNIPYKLRIQYRQVRFDTVLVSTANFRVPASIAPDSTGALFCWTVAPADSKTKASFFLAIIPAAMDLEIIGQQLKQLRLTYNRQPDMLRLMEKDLFERWMELYQLQVPKEELPAQ